MSVLKVVIIDHKMGNYKLVSEIVSDQINEFFKNYQETAEKHAEEMMVEELISDEGIVYGNRYANASEGLLYDLIVCTAIASTVKEVSNGKIKSDYEK